MQTKCIPYKHYHINTAKWKPRDLGDLKSLIKQVVSGKHLLEVEIPFSKVILHHLYNYDKRISYQGTLPTHAAVSTEQFNLLIDY